LPTVAVNCCVVVATTLVEDGSVSTVIAGTVIEAAATANALDTEVAVTETAKSLAGGPGAVYVIATPLAVAAGATLPHGAVAQDTAQVTPLLLGSPATVAVTGVLAPSNTLAVLGERDKPTDGMVICAGLVFVGSVTEVAVRVTVKLLAGGVAGAV